ncbi:SPASM domain-containing protein [Prosthecochloris sp. GSB1]|uniref:SPASM domain-containing protein n=1 Tax=Prosthecochloris sp. GSB1 TaxID=281093 RepID=UPI003FA768F3
MEFCCYAGKQLIHISHQGSVAPCSWLYKVAPDRFTLGNIKTSSLHFCLMQSNLKMQGLVDERKGCPVEYVHSRSI